MKKPHKCAFCGKTFLFDPDGPGVLRSLMESIEVPGSPQTYCYQCPFCQQWNENTIPGRKT